MVKDKKQNYSNQHPHKNKNLKKDNPSPRPNDQFKGKKNNHQRGNNKKVVPNTINDFQLPPIKQKIAPVAPSSAQQVQPATVQKKIMTAKPQQIQEVLSQLTSLQTLLNSYEELQMDENENIKTLVESILQKQTKSE